MVFLIENSHFQIFVEYIVSINNILNIPIIRYNKGECIIISEKIKFIIIVHQLPLLDFSKIDHKVTVFFLNTEQLTRKNVSNTFNNILLHLNSLYNKYLNEKPIVLDFSQSNIDYFKNFMPNNDSNYFKTIHLPYLPYKTEIDYLYDLYNKTPKEYDIAFIGSSSMKRHHMICLLQQAGFSVYRVEEKWGEERDRELAKCRMLLNVHCDDDFKIFECIRCDRWIFGGMKVLSETSLETPYDNPFLRVDNYINLVTRAKEYINQDISFEIDKKTIEEKKAKIIEFKNLLDSL